MMENEKPSTTPPEIFAFPEMVCHRMLPGDPTYIPKAEYQGRTIYFCTEACLNAFLSDPDSFYAAHGRRRVAPKKCEFNNETG